MKVKILKNAVTFGEFKVGDIVEAKRFKDFTDEEKSREDVAITSDDNDIFAKKHEVNWDGCEYLIMFDEEVEIIEE